MADSAACSTNLVKPMPQIIEVLTWMSSLSLVLITTSSTRGPLPPGAKWFSDDIWNNVFKLYHSVIFVFPTTFPEFGKEKTSCNKKWPVTPSKTLRKQVPQLAVASLLFFKAMLWRHIKGSKVSVLIWSLSRVRAGVCLWGVCRVHRGMPGW